jgi:hypothetical protein
MDSLRTVLPATQRAFFEEIMQHAKVRETQLIGVCIDGRTDGQPAPRARARSHFISVRCALVCLPPCLPLPSQAARALWSSPADARLRLGVSDHFIGLQLMGRNNSAEKLSHYVRNLQPGVTEYMVGCFAIFSQKGG